jgi:cell division FtsZ-interacting protein ZapD
MLKQETQMDPQASAPVDFDHLAALRQRVGIPGTFVVFDLDTEARWSYGNGKGTCWHYGVRGTTHGLDPVAVHMTRESAEFLAAALNTVSGISNEAGARR